MDPHVVWFAKEMLAPALLGRSVSELRRAWNTKLAGLVRSESREVRLRKGRLKRWLSRPDTWDDLCRSNERRHLQYLVEGVLEHVFTKRQRAQSSARADAESIVGILLVAFHQSLDPSSAVSVAHFQQMRELRTIRTHLEDEDAFDEHIAALPPSVRTYLTRARATSREHAPRFAAILATCPDPADAARGIAADPPECLIEGPPVLWAAAGEFSLAHNQLQPAARAFERAAGAGAEPRAWLYVSAALAAANDDQRDALRLFERAKALGTLGNTAVAFIEAAIAKDLAAVRGFRHRIDDVDATFRNRMRGMVAAAFAPEDLNEAVNLAKSALEVSPHSAGVQIELATWLHQLGNRPVPDAARYRRDAIRYAEAARDLRRSWRGPSEEAVAVLLRIHLAQGSFGEVVKHGVAPPAGSALAREARDPEIRELVAVAMVALGDLDGARRQIDGLREGSARWLVEGIIAEAAGDSELASTKYANALEAADSPEERLQVQTSLAINGTWPIPGWDQTLIDQPEMAHRMEVMSLAARGDTDGAVLVLRRHLDDSRLHAQLHASVLAGGGRTTEAVEVLESAAARFDDAHMLVSAAELCVDQPERAEPLLRGAITRLDLESSRRARTGLAQLLLELERAPEVDAILRPLHEADPTDTEVRWGLTLALALIGRLDQAWAVYSLPPRPRPTTEWQAGLWVDLHLRYEMSPETVEMGLDLARTFADSEEFISALAIAILVSGDELLEDSEDLKTAFRAFLDDFIERFPDSPALVQKPASLDTLIELVRSRSETDETIRATIERVRDGVLPAGILGPVSHRSVSSALLMRPTGYWYVHRHGDPAFSSELEAAQNAIGSKVALDITTLALIAAVPAVGDLIARHTVRRFISHTTLRDIQIGVTELRTPVHSIWGWNTEEERPEVIKIDPQARTLLSERAELMEGFAARIELQAGTRGWSRDALPNDHDAWLAGMDVAFALGIPMLCDDVALRDFARDHGVQVFGSVAFITALDASGALEPDEAGVLFAGLVREYCADVPLTAAHLERAAAMDAWEPKGAAFALSRIATWQQLGVDALRFYRRALSAAANLGHDLIVGWMTSAIRVLPSVPPEARAELIPTLFLQAALGAGAIQTMAPKLLPAFRAATHEILGLPDPLPAAARKLYELVAEELPATFAVQYVLHAFSGLADADRAIVLRALISE